MEVILTDNYPISSRIITDEGFLIVEGILSRTGIQEYSASQLYDAKYLKDNGIDPKKIIKLYRPPEEVFDDESLKSLDKKPITLGHPKGNIVNSTNWQRLSKGEISNVQKRDEKTISGTLTIRAKDAVDAVNAGKKELSVGYSSHVEMKPGMTPEGEQYDGIQTRIRGNHHAIVDAGRCGAMCRINDEELNDNPGEKKMTTRVVMADSVAIETDLIAAAQIERLAGERNAAMALVDSASKTSGELKIKADKLEEKLALSDAKNVESTAKITALEAEVKAKPSVIKLGDKEVSIEDAAKLFQDMEDAKKALEEKIPSPKVIDELVGKRMKMVAAGKKVAPNVVADGKACDEYRKEVVKVASAANPSLKAIADAVLVDGLDTADENSIKAAFNAITAAQVAAEGNRKQTTLGDAILDASGSQATPTVSPKQKAEDTIRNAWETKKSA